MREFTPEEIQRHDALVDQATRLVEGQLHLADEPSSGQPNWLVRRRLKKALAMYDEILTIHPENSSSHWFKGKIHQRLGQDEHALDSFAKSHRFNPQNPDMAREAGLAALNVGDVQQALYFCQTAISLSPGDPGLVANLAWAYVIEGDLEKARRTIQEAVSAAPEDKVSLAIQKFIEEIAFGKRPQIKSMRDIEEG